MALKKTFLANIRGRAVEMRRSGAYLQWRLEGTTDAWKDLFPLADIQGLPGFNAVPTDEGVAQLISTGGASATKAALAATYATKESLQRFRVGLAKSSTRTGFCRILAVGDSITAGAGASASIHLKSYPALLRNLLEPTYGDGGSGRSWPAPNVPPYTGDTRWSFTGGFAPFAAGPASRTNFVSATASGAKATYVSDRAGTSITFYHSANSAAFTYAIDGGAPVPVAFVAGPNGWKSVTVTGLADTVHTIVFATTTAAYVAVGAVDVTRSTGLVVDNAGVGGSLTHAWAYPTAQWFDVGRAVAASVPTADLVLMESMLINDAKAGVTPADHKARFKAIIVNFSIADMVVIIPPTPNPAQISTAVFGAIRTAAREAAVESDLPIFDVSARWGTYAAAVTAGFMADDFHPSDAGYADMAAGLHAMLIP